MQELHMMSWVHCTLLELHRSQGLEQGQLQPLQVPSKPGLSRTLQGLSQHKWEHKIPSSQVCQLNRWVLPHCSLSQVGHTW